MSEPTVIHARHFATGEWVRVTIDGPTILSVDAAEQSTSTIELDLGLDPDIVSITTESPSPLRSGGDLDPWIAPAFWDLQVNGRWGVSFSDPTITPEQVARIAYAQAALGTARFCPTLITASREATLAGVSAIASACDNDSELNRRILGIHLEGPWISPLEGYRGAHPRDHVRNPDWSEFQEYQRASGSRILMVTLAPELPGAIDMIRRLKAMGVTVAIGHSAADAETISQAVGAGLRMATHLGNGVPRELPRHPNPIWNQTAQPSLWASFIADGQHVDFQTLRVLVHAKSPRALLVSDASPLVGSPPGLYGPWEVLEDGRIMLAGTAYLAGSSGTLFEAVENLMRELPLRPEVAFEYASKRPAKVLRLAPPELAPGQPSDLLLYRIDVEEPAKIMRLLATCCGGAWTMAGSGA